MSSEPLDLNGALALVLKKALSHDGLSRGLHEVVRALEKGQAQLVVLAEDCNQPDYKKLVEALSAEQSANLLSVKEAQQLGTWAGVGSTASPLATLATSHLYVVSRCKPCKLTHSG